MLTTHDFALLASFLLFCIVARYCYYVGLHFPYQPAPVLRSDPEEEILFSVPRQLFNGDVLNVTYSSKRTHIVRGLKLIH